MHKIRQMRTKHTQATRRGGDTSRVRRGALTHCIHHTHSHTVSPQQLCILRRNTQITNGRCFKHPPGAVVTFVWKGEVLQWSQQQNKTTFDSLSPPPSSTPHYHTAHLLSSSSVTAVALTSSSTVIIIILIIIVILPVIVTTAATI